MNLDDRTKLPVVAIERAGTPMLAADETQCDLEYAVKVEGEHIKTVRILGRIPAEIVRDPQHESATPGQKLDALRYWYYLPKLGAVVRGLYQEGGIDAIDLMPASYDWREEPLPADLTFPQPEHKDLWIGRR